MKRFQKLFHVLWNTLQLSTEVVDLLEARGNKSCHGMRLAVKERGSIAGHVLIGHLSVNDGPGILGCLSMEYDLTPVIARR